jgi:hypothetical protein
VLDDAGDTVLETWTPPDRDGLHALVQRVDRFGEPVGAVIEAMNGARFVHDHLELLGWEVEIADAAKVKGLAPLACTTDRIDAWGLAELSRRDLVPAIWLPTSEVRAERERARWRLHLVKRRTALKNRVHSILIAFGYPKLASDLLGIAAGPRSRRSSSLNHGTPTCSARCASSTSSTSTSPVVNVTCGLSVRSIPTRRC